MKKKYICTFLFFILLSSTIIRSTGKALNSNHYREENIGKTNALFEENEFDELDELIEDAIDSGLIKNDITPPSKLELFLTRVAITVFLKPYIYIVTKYRILKKWFAKFYYKKDEKDNPEANKSE